MARRRFVDPLIRCCILTLGLWQVALASLSKNSYIQSFSLADVDLAEHSDFAEGEALNHAYLLQLDVDNLLYNFRTTAGLPAPGQSYGGWEGPAVEVRGQFIGHYLSALAFAYKHTGDQAFADRGDAMVQGLAECQAAWGDGYLSAFPKSFWDRLESLQPVWAPYYVIHKLLAGLLAQHQLAQQPQALDVALGMAAYYCGRCHKVVREKGEEHWHKVLETEFGGMNEVLYHLYLETGDERWVECAHLFDKPAWFDPLAQGQDTLPGRHANTHLAQVNGFAARFDATGDPKAAAAVANFFDIVTGSHSYSTGGSNWFEGWGQPKSLGDAIDNPAAAANTQESCTQYNILKIARSLFRWTGRAEFADFYERAILNGVLGIQRKPHAHAHGHSSHHHAIHTHSNAFLQNDDPSESIADAQGEGNGHGHLWPHVNVPGFPGGLDRPSMLEAEAQAIALTNALHMAAPKPENYKVVSWPDDPAAVVKRSGGNDDEVTPGQYIYYMPLGHDGGKGDNPGAWTHGWGDRFNTFWCCYGTAVESFSKLADSIYFWKDSESRSNSNSTSDAQGAGSALAGVQAKIAVNNSSSEGPPELYVNQIVSSTLHWRHMGVTVTQTAELYSTEDNVARSTLKITCADAPSSTTNNAKGNARGSGCQIPAFNLLWRVPSWVPAQGLMVSLNGIAMDDLPRVKGAHGGGRMSAGAGEEVPLWFRPPQFGDGADYVVVGPEWHEGDTVEVEMAMAIRTEDLNDQRHAMRPLKAILLGPFHMAGLTEGNRTINLDPSDIASAVTLPSSGPLLSLSDPANKELLLHVTSASSVGCQRLQGGSRAAALAATFTAVRVPVEEAYEGLHSGAEGEGGGERYVLESVLLPGRYLSLGRPKGSAGCDAAWALTPDRDAAASFERHAKFATSMSAGGENLGARSLQVTLSAPSAGKERLMPRALTLLPGATATYPKGARVLTGKTQKYLIVPIGQLIDEHYTGYWEFVDVAPSVAMGGSGAAGHGGGVEFA